MRERLQQLLSVPGRRMLGITGPPGAGKSTLARRVAGWLGPSCVVVPMDGFHLANVQLARLGRSGRKGAPDTFDAAGYVALLRRLHQPNMHETVYAPEFHREIEESIAAAIAVPSEVRLLVTEGNYLLLDDPAWQPVRTLLDEVWYVELNDSMRRERLVRRHSEFGRSQSDAERWVEQTDEPNARLIEQTRHLASLVVSEQTDW